VTGVLVVDASAVLATILADDQRGDAAAARMRGASLVAPELIDYEILNSLRRRRAAGQLSDGAGRTAVDVWRSIPLELWSVRPLVDRLWALTGALSAYDAAYVALAERLGAPLLTADRRLANAPGVRAEIVLV
jgi:predicted nucleic acid-binding protein